MAGIQAKSFVDGDVLLAFREALQADRTKVRRVFFIAITREGSAAENMRRALSKEPGGPKYPIRWKSAKQRRFVMAKLRRENNLPYQRTHHLSQSWTVTVDDPLDVLIRNSDPAARYVQGEDQQPYHIDSGWGYAPGVIREYAAAITEDLVDAYLKFVIGYRQ